MRRLTEQQLILATQAKVLSSHQKDYQGIGTDTRENLKGQLFIALKGEAFDAHQFLSKALDQGASALLVHEESPEIIKISEKISVYVVQDTLKALQNLGHWARKQSNAKILGITGSNGKTTTKEFTAALIGSCRKVHFNQGSFNNHWGVPFTLLQIPENCDVAIVEMGMNHAGELTELVQIAEPDVVVCTTVGRAHIEFFGSVEKIAEAKAEIYEASKSQVSRIYNLDNEQTRQMYGRGAKRYGPESILTFSSEDPKADVHFVLTSMNLKEIQLKGTVLGVEGQVTVPVFGRQNLVNLMAAATLGLAAGLTAQEVWAGLPFCKTNWGRNQLVSLRSGAQMIFDAYNANPDSMKALIDNVQTLDLSGKKIGVFGQMREIGSSSPTVHAELGSWVGRAGYDRVYFIGQDWKSFKEGLQSSSFNGFDFIDADFSEVMAEDLKKNLQQGDLVTVKASRGTKLERFVPYCEPLDFSAKS